jgi:hypothetical protein
MSRRIVLLMFTLLVAGIEYSVAQKTNSAEPIAKPKERIFIGQQVADSLQVLRSRQIAFEEGGMATSVNENTSYYTFTLDQNHVHVCLAYSKSKKEISGISMIFFPHRRNQVKSALTWIAATEVAIRPDGTFVVHFAKPTTAEETIAQDANLGTTKVLGLNVPIVGARELENHVGKLIAVVGVPDNSKIARIANVEVRCPDKLRGQRAIAAGILGKWDATDQQVAKLNRKGIAHDGPGVKYLLYSSLKGELAEARPFKPN